jgi:hypothetical protein
MDDYTFGWNLAKAIFEAGREDAADFARKKSSRKSKPTAGRSYTRGAGKKQAKPPNKSSDLKTKKSCSKGTACGRSCIAANKVCGGQTLKNTVRAAAEYLKRGTTTSGKKLSKADQRRIQELSDDAQRQLDQQAKPPAKPQKGGAIVPAGGKISQQREAAKGKSKPKERKRTREEALVQLYRMQQALGRAGHKQRQDRVTWDSFDKTPGNLEKYMTVGSGGLKTEIRKFKRKPPTKAQIEEQRRKVEEAKAFEKAIGPDNVAAARDFYHYGQESRRLLDRKPWQPYPSARVEEAKLAMMQGDGDKATKLYQQELEIEQKRREAHRAVTPMSTEGKEIPERLRRSQEIRARRHRLVQQAMRNLVEGRDLIDPKEGTALGVRLTGNKDADLRALKSQYRKMARELHPDMGGDPDAFIEMDRSYQKALESYGQPKQREDLTMDDVLSGLSEAAKQVRAEDQVAEEAKKILRRTGQRTNLSSYSDQWYGHDNSPNK